jgi:hypothetical protein
VAAKEKVDIAMPQASDGSRSESASSTVNDAHPESETKLCERDNRRDDGGGGSDSVVKTTTYSDSIPGVTTGNGSIIENVANSSSEGGVMDSTEGGVAGSTEGGVAGSTEGGMAGSTEGGMAGSTEGGAADSTEADSTGKGVVDSAEGAESAVLKRMEDTFQHTLDTQEQLRMLTQLIGAMEKAPMEFPLTTPVVEPTSETGLPGEASAVGDAIVHAALSGARIEDSREEEVLEACQQSSDSAKASKEEMVIVGEVYSGPGGAERERLPDSRVELAETVVEPTASEVATTPTRDPDAGTMPNHTPDQTSVDAAVSTSDTTTPTLPPQSPIPASPKSSAASKGPSKRSRFQLAASFTHQQ